MTTAEDTLGGGKGTSRRSATTMSLRREKASPNSTASESNRGAERERKTKGGEFSHQHNTYSEKDETLKDKAEARGFTTRERT